MRSRLSPLAAAALLLGGCTYDFSNPAEELDAGEVAGRVVADTGSGATGLAGVDVRLRNSASIVAQTTRANGRFILLGLMPGRHTVQFERKDYVTPTAGWATTREVEVVWGSDGQPEGTFVGDVRVYSAVDVGGTLAIPASAIAGGFVFLGGYAVDDLTGAIGAVTPTTASTFTYSFTGLPIGAHRFRIVVVGTELGSVATAYGIGPIDRELGAGEAGTSLQLPDATGTPTSGFGKLRFQVDAPTALVAGLGYTATVNRAGSATAEYCSVYSDGTRECDLSAGVYYVTVAPNGGAYTGPPTVVGVVSADQTTELGAIYITDDGVASRAASSCIDSTDCLSMYLCVEGTCEFSGGMEPAMCLTGTSIEGECAAGFCAGSTPPYNTPCNGGNGVCGETITLITVCIPNGYPVCDYITGTQVIVPTCP